MPRFHGRIQRAETTPSLLQPPAGASPHQFPSWNQSSSLLNLGGALRAIATRRAHFPRFIYLRVFWKGAGGGRERGTSASQGSSWERRPKNPTGTGSTPAAPLGGEGRWREDEGRREHQELHPSCSTRAGWQLQQTPKPTRTDVSWFHTGRGPSDPGPEPFLRSPPQNPACHAARGFSLFTESRSGLGRKGP